MQKLGDLFRNFFLATGVLWFLCGLSIIIFNFHFETKEIVISLVLPLSYAIVRMFDASGRSA
ncbi:hypothetical protein EDD80_1294 [Anseongella ginsenosidimutans]|uniref:Uncharacterized protein n=1 Tax=Anseongella ginsenosidimutans TaxID=496056 RepID=A0A4R3KJB0_9SPHI|nr:hypothetical protein EDD80_1294 [Anseongella ginsenosidimutans]